MCLLLVLFFFLSFSRSLSLSQNIPTTLIVSLQNPLRKSHEIPSLCALTDGGDTYSGEDNFQDLFNAKAYEEERK